MNGPEVERAAPTLHGALRHDIPLWALFSSLWTFTGILTHALSCKPVAKVGINII